MENGSNYDHIDRELSRTYFRDAVSHPLRDKERETSSASKKRNSFIKRFALPLSKTILILCALFLIIALLSFMTHFFKNKKIFFTIVDGTPKSAKTVKTTRIGKHASNSTPSYNIDSFINTEVLFDFEDNTENWEIPAWAHGKPDHVATGLAKITGMASNGTSSLEMYVDFPGKGWSAAYIEIVQYLDLGDFDYIASDIYLPHSCPTGLQAKFIVTAGTSWRFIEMSRSIPLIPGKWNTLIADISENSRDWRRTSVDDSFKRDIRKIGIRIESNPRPAYSGPIYIDNVRLLKRKK